jgi:hypothetical protein
MQAGEGEAKLLSHAQEGSEFRVMLEGPYLPDVMPDPVLLDMGRAGNLLAIDDGGGTHCCPFQG